MKKVWIIIPVLMFFAIGCTPPTQGIAESALQRGVDHDHTIINDLATMALHTSLDNAVAAVLVASAANDTVAVQAAVENLATQYAKVSWLLIQHERSRALIRVGQTFIWGQKGIFDIMAKEFTEAKKRSNLADEE